MLLPPWVIRGKEKVQRTGTRYIHTLFPYTLPAAVICIFTQVLPLYIRCYVFTRYFTPEMGAILLVNEAFRVLNQQSVCSVLHWCLSVQPVVSYKAGEYRIIIQSQYIGSKLTCTYTHPNTHTEKLLALIPIETYIVHMYSDDILYVVHTPITQVCTLEYNTIRSGTHKST